jgi:hypothetical protein
MDISKDAQKVMDMGAAKHRQFRYIGVIEMLAAQIAVGNWIFNPIEKDNSIIPRGAMKRVDDIKALGVPINGMVVAHDTHKPKLLMKPVFPYPMLNKPEPKPEPKPAREPINLWPVVEIIGVILLSIVKIAYYMIYGTVWFVFGIVGLAFQIGLADPALIVVLEDGSWIEVARWEDSS